MRRMESEDMEIDVSTEDDSEYEEDLLVYIEIDPTLLTEKQVKEATSVKIYGVETKKPLLKINNHFFEGDYDLSIGTHTFFERAPETPVDELYCKTGCYYKYAVQTNKILKMSRVLLQNNATTLKLDEEKDETDIRKQLEVKKSYEQALNQFLAPGRNPPRKISGELNGENLLNLKT